MNFVIHIAQASCSARTLQADRSQLHSVCVNCQYCIILTKTHHNFRIVNDTFNCGFLYFLNTKGNQFVHVMEVNFPAIFNRLRGVSGVRIVDASVMPNVVSGNTMAASIMIGEKGADLIKEDWGYQLDTQEFKDISVL